MAETWKTAVATEGRYEVSDCGRVRRSDGLLLTPSVPRDQREYPCVMLRYSGLRRRVAVHRLVAINFLGLPPFAGAMVRHLDGNHLNSHVSNLAWGTGKDNAADRERHGRTARGDKHGQFGKRFAGSQNGVAKLTEDDARTIRALAATRTQKSIAEQFGVHRAVIWRIVRRKGWTHVD